MIQVRTPADDTLANTKQTQCDLSHYALGLFPHVNLLLVYFGFHFCAFVCISGFLFLFVF